MEAGRQPITFENPLYATGPVSGDPAVIHATQVLTNEEVNLSCAFAVVCVHKVNEGCVLLETADICGLELQTGG